MMADTAGGWAAPLFSFLSGLSLSLAIARQEGEGRSREEITKSGVRRGLFLFGVGIAFACLIWLPRDIFDWDILTLLGTSTMIIIALRKRRPALLLAICVLVLVASPPLRLLSDYAIHWVKNDYRYDLSLDQVVLGFMLNGYFPLLPWITFPVMGFLVGEMVVRKGRPGEPWPVSLPLGGVALMVVAGLGMVFEPYAPAWLAQSYLKRYSFYPASTVYLLWMMGQSAVALWLLHRWIDGDGVARSEGAVIRFCRRYSYFALTVYIVHHAVHLWPLWILAAWTGTKDPTYFQGRVVTAPIALALAMVFVLAFNALAPALDRRSKYSLEGFMRWICG
jgi:uncharacterized membrane protein